MTFKYLMTPRDYIYFMSYTDGSVNRLRINYWITYYNMLLNNATPNYHNSCWQRSNVCQITFIFFISSDVTFLWIIYQYHVSFSFKDIWIGTYTEEKNKTSRLTKKCIVRMDGGTDNMHPCTHTHGHTYLSIFTCIYINRFPLLFTWWKNK